jgi:hypothetical protein
MSLETAFNCRKLSVNQSKKIDSPQRIFVLRERWKTPGDPKVLANTAKHLAQLFSLVLKVRFPYLRNRTTRSSTFTSLDS